jgi:23S rRNA pseudouridine1911/1915/1917 synthase
MERNIHKRYKAIVLGTPKITKIEAPIGRHPVKRQEMAVCYEKGREATTYLSVLKSMQEVSLLDVNLITGRTHQIRVHLKHIGHPVLGDPLYGNKTLNAKRGLTRQMLHAESISFIHPRTKQEVTVTAPLPQDMQDCLCALF